MEANFILAISLSIEYGGPRQIYLHANRNETSLTVLFRNNKYNWDQGFFNYPPSAPICNFRKAMLVLAPSSHEFMDKELMIQTLKMKDYPMPENQNTGYLRSLCKKTFYGPVVLCFSSRTAPYCLENMTLEDYYKLISLPEAIYCNSTIQASLVPRKATSFEFKKLMEDNQVSIPYNEFKILLKNIEKFEVQFYIFRFKTSFCPHTYQHNIQTCKFAHDSTDFRRPPDKFKYKPVDCKFKDKCNNLINCQYCHSKHEKIYHPRKYKTSKCKNLIDKKYCVLEGCCAFIHNKNEKRKIKRNTDLSCKLPIIIIEPPPIIPRNPIPTPQENKDFPYPVTQKDPIRQPFIGGITIDPIPIKCNSSDEDEEEEKMFPKASSVDNYPNPFAAFSKIIWEIYQNVDSTIEEFKKEEENDENNPSFKSDDPNVSFVKELLEEKKSFVNEHEKKSFVQELLEEKKSLKSSLFLNMQDSINENMKEESKNRKSDTVISLFLEKLQMKKIGKFIKSDYKQLRKTIDPATVQRDKFSDPDNKNPSFQFSKHPDNKIPSFQFSKD